MTTSSSKDEVSTEDKPMAMAGSNSLRNKKIEQIVPGPADAPGDEQRVRELGREVRKTAWT